MIILVTSDCLDFFQHLKIFHPRIGDDALIAIGKGCSLHHLNVSECVKIGDAGLIAIARGCPQLAKLDVSVLQVPCSLSLVMFVPSMPLG